MSTIKTLVNDANVNDFIDAVDDPVKRADSFRLLEIYSEITQEPAKMWGTSIIGFGQYHYKSERSTQEGDWMITGFSPRKQNLTLYFMDGFEAYGELLGKLGKHKVSKGCLYLNKLADVDEVTLRELISQSYLAMKATHK